MTKKKQTPRRRARVDWSSTARRPRPKRRVPVVRPSLRSGRASFLRALRGKIAKIEVDYTLGGRGRTRKSPEAMKSDVLEIVDAALARYRGD